MKQAAIAERRIRLAFAQLCEADAEIAERSLEHRQQPHIVQRIGEQAADQEFQAEVIDPLGAGVVAQLFGCQPVMHDAVAQRQRRRLVPVVAGRHPGVLADGKPELGEDRALDLGQRQFVDGLAERRIISLERLVGQILDPRSVSPGESYLRYVLFGTRGRFRLCSACINFKQGPGRFTDLCARRPGDIVGPKPQNTMSRYQMGRSGP